MHCAFCTVCPRLCMASLKINSKLVSFLYLSRFHFVVRLLWTGLHRGIVSMTAGSVSSTHTHVHARIVYRAVPVCVCTCACMYLCTHLHMHNRHPIVFTSVMNSTVLITASYRPPLPDRFLEKFTLRQPTDETLYACQIFNGAGTVELRQYCRL